MQRHLLALGQHQAALLDVRRLVDAPVVQRGVIFGHAQRRKESNVLGELFGIIAGRRNRKERRSRIEIHRRNVELDMRGKLPDIQPHQPGHRLQHGKFKFHPHPRAPLAARDFHGRRCAATMHAQPPPRTIDLHADFTARVSRRIGARVTRPDQMRSEGIACIQMHDLFILSTTLPAILRVKRSRTLAAAQIGHAHARKHSPAHLVGRKRHRAAKNGRGDSGVAEQFPEGNSAALIYHARCGKSILGPLKSRQRKIGKISIYIPAHKIEHSVAAGIRAGRKR